MTGAIALLGALAACVAPEEATQETPPAPDEDGGEFDAEPARDSDGDGLDDASEAALGTDPTNADTDADLWADGQEVTLGTNPLLAYSHPYEEGDYHVGGCETGVAAGPTGPQTEADLRGYSWPVYVPGDVAANFTLTDQYGQEVELYSFCGNAVTLLFVAAWSVEAQGMSAAAAALQAKLADQGYQAIVVLVESSNGDVPSQETQGAWAETCELEGMPVLADDSGTLEEIWAPWETDWALPTVAHLAPDMTVLAVDVTNPDPRPYWTR